MKTFVSVLIMLLAGTIGFFAGALFNEALHGAILFSLIAGIACIISAIDDLKRS